MTKQCANCNYTFTSPYCPSCGQKAGTGKLTMHHIADEAWHGFTHTDKGVIRLWKDLLLNPGETYRNYFKGRRKMYYSPVVFFLLSFGLYIYFDQQVFNYEDYIVQKRTGHLLNNEIGRFAQEHAKYIALCLLPVQALFSYLFFYKRYNLAECIIFWLFCVAFANTILVLLTPFRLLFINQKQNLDYILSLLVIAVYLWHTLAVFGADLRNMLTCLLLVLIVSIANLYIGFYFLAFMAPPYYPSLWESLQILFSHRNPFYYNGKWTLK